MYNSFYARASMNTEEYNTFEVGFLINW
jgi:hypothetical protein